MNRITKAKIALGLIVLGVLLIIVIFFVPYLISPPSNIGGYFVAEASFILAAGVCFLLALLLFSAILMNEGRMKRVAWWTLEGALGLIIIGGLGTIWTNIAVFNSLNSQQGFYLNPDVSTIIQIATDAAPLLAFLGGGIMLYSLVQAKIGQS